jgi:hypothetical protein
MRYWFKEPGNKPWKELSSTHYTCRINTINGFIEKFGQPNDDAEGERYLILPDDRMPAGWAIPLRRPKVKG